MGRECPGQRDERAKTVSSSELPELKEHNRLPQRQDPKTLRGQAGCPLPCHDGSNVGNHPLRGVEAHDTHAMEAFQAHLREETPLRDSAILTVT